MTQATFVEQVIEVASRLKDCVTALKDAYLLLPSVITRENEAIASREFGLVSDACSAKEEIGDKVDAAFTRLTLTGERFGKLLSSYWPDKPRPTNLSEYKEALNNLAEALASEQFSTQVLAHVAQVFGASVDDFFTVYLDVKPKIEANRYLVTHMMRNYQESYRFWQEVSEQVAVSYNAHGVQKAAGRNSGFRAKA